LAVNITIIWLSPSGSATPSYRDTNFDRVERIGSDIIWVLGIGDRFELEDRGFESLEFYQESLKLLKAAYRKRG